MSGGEFFGRTHVEYVRIPRETRLYFHRSQRRKRWQIGQGRGAGAIDLGILQKVVRPRWQVGSHLLDELFPALDLESAVGQSFSPDGGGALGAHVAAAE